MRRLAVLGVLCLSACGPTTSAPPPSTPTRVAGQPSPSAWLTRLDRDHALVGKVWDVAAAAFVEPNDLAKRLAGAQFVLLGERHDNPDHHRLQGSIIEQLVKAGRRPAVVLEMLEVGQQPAVDQYLARSDAGAAGFGAALGWEKTSWPPFEQYQPIFDAALVAKLPIVAGNLAQADAKALVKQGVSALAPERARELRLEQTFPASLEATLIDELRASHCGQLPENLLAPMALAQHARDAQMAKSLAQAGAKDGAVLIAGGGHARRDRGVPYYLALETPGAKVASLVFQEVRHAETDARSYQGDEGPFDYVWFTPRATDEDPCAAFQPKTK
jgi:uncharacterized iron-regulated protein